MLLFPLALVAGCLGLLGLGGGFIFPVPFLLLRLKPTHALATSTMAIVLTTIATMRLALAAGRPAATRVSLDRHRVAGLRVVAAKVDAPDIPVRSIKARRPVPALVLPGAEAKVVDPCSSYRGYTGIVQRVSGQRAEVLRRWQLG